MAHISNITTSDQPALAWEVVPLLPARGEWSEEDYLWLSNRSNHLVEFSDGCVEVLPMPTEEHQRIVLFLYRFLYQWITAFGAGLVLVAPLRVRLANGKYREPDLVLLLSDEDPRRHNEYWEGADLVVEVVSPDDPDRDFVTKRQEYAQARITEYWIVDPQSQTITVLHLEQGTYAEHGAFKRGTTLTSVLLPGCSVGADAVLRAR